MYLFIFIHLLFHISHIFSLSICIFLSLQCPLLSSFQIPLFFIYFFPLHRITRLFHSHTPPVSLFFSTIFFFSLALLHFSQSLSGIFYSSHYHHQTPPANHHPSHHHHQHSNTWQFFQHFSPFFPPSSATITALVTHTLR